MHTIARWVIVVIPCDMNVGHNCARCRLLSGKGHRIRKGHRARKTTSSNSVVYK